MSAKHTPTPWVVLPEECDKPYIRVRGTVLGARFKVANVLAPVYEGVHQREAEETRANARRIAACVNACEGIGTERLEDLGRPLMQHLIGCDERAARQVKEAADLTAQRDELLAALKVLVENGGIGPESMFDDARAAIAKATGGKA